MRIAIGGDSAGNGMAGMLAQYLRDRGEHDVCDMSAPPGGGSELYASLSERVGQAIMSGEFDRGILCCGTGIGVCISANKIPGIRAALTHDTYSAERAALSNNAHIITMGARVIGPEVAKSIVNAWLACSFDPQGPSARNVAGIDALGEKYAHAEPAVTTC
ncbi:ribose-5-phosphate isomerase [Komagataeibacter nataicola]|uniref:Ribose-5-phosphate isomerase n=1 Tax=Komagataeibacter nataicola TaxID=265960 RepID=A0A9N7CZJ8_9PROT|nr:RpiB/LacA/LacB family sugar-phosphate isomerase [Komagataeibacter nataicola]AQU88696.1 ribose-5-phosphate isomerase [Komagataeibacter nataicola]PYD66695.1 ribose-5-phosphate isomerase [Komagataeibacter nataicola]WEQ57055.1 RpiB/LacA/LacB family sugar-phosphate isomerase [Komagataeibacter nataicola]